ncbi:MAG TPA: Rid family hydrolase [Acidimicrobiales bacterium]|nr:Rid family hydrolase [Acidimicrobiales bacterium]
MAPKRPYSLWRRAGDFVIISGQLGVLPDHETTTFAEGGTAAELRQALANAKNVLAEAGATLADVVKASLFILDMNDWAACNEVWLETFTDPLPTRTAVAVSQLPLGAKAEVELWAYAPEV